MAQTKHTFVESKMNKDLDDRLLSGGQYRDALNVAVSKSEDSDVGALENVLGNDLISSLFQANQTIPPNLQVIGGYVSNEKNSIYLNIYSKYKFFYFSASYYYIETKLKSSINQKYNMAG